MTNSALRLRTPDGVRAAVDALSNGHPVTRVDSGREPVWRIAPEDEHEAAFYRNTLIDAFLETSIVELALAYAARAETDRLEAFWSQVMRLRDLLKFDFYFADSAAFREHVAEEMSWHEDWEAHVAAGGEEIDELLRAKRPLIAGAMLRPFFEAYEIVADVLRDAPAKISEKELTKQALGVGRQYVAQGRVRSNEAVSALLFATARQVAADQNLLETAADLAERRAASCAELRAILNDMDKVEQVAREQFYAREMERRRLRSVVAASSVTPYAGRMTTVAPPACAAARCGRCSSASALLAGVTAAGIGALSLADALTATGLPDPGPVTTYGLPFVRAAGEIAAVVAVGSFLFAAFLVPPQTTGVLDAGGYRALRMGTAASALWAVCAAMLVPLTVSDVSGQPLREHLNPVEHLVGGQPRRHRGSLAVDRVHRRRGHPGQPPGAALVVDAGAAGRRADHAGAAGADRPFVGGRRARSGHQQPADPSRRRGAVGGRPAGAAGSRDAGGRARGPGRTPILGPGVLVLRRDGRQRRRQRAGAHPPCPIWCAPNTAGW